jgi:hypothetical protein
MIIKYLLLVIRVVVWSLNDLLSIFIMNLLIYLTFEVADYLMYDVALIFLFDLLRHDCYQQI